MDFVFPECAVAPNAMTVLLVVVCCILIMGIVLLALWKLAITIHDRREFARFQSARSRARYEMVRTSCVMENIATINDKCSVYVFVVPPKLVFILLLHVHITFLKV